MRRGNEGLWSVCIYCERVILLGGDEVVDMLENRLCGTKLDFEATTILKYFSTDMVATSTAFPTQQRQ